ncbi:hypothetical protein ACB092_01G323000 [Castanea dentata]
MEFFKDATAVRLRSHFNKYLVAEDDEEKVRQRSNGASNRAFWTIEFVEENSNLIRLKSCHGKYLKASDEPFLLGMTGNKVLQAMPVSENDSSIEWEPRKDGVYLKLRTKSGNYLRGNGGTPPWRNTVTHDLPSRTATQEWILWEVDMDITRDRSFLSSFSLNSSVAEDSEGSECSETSMPSVISIDVEIASERKYEEGSGNSKKSDEDEIIKLGGQVTEYQRREKKFWLWLLLCWVICGLLIFLFLSSVMSGSTTEQYLFYLKLKGFSFGNVDARFNWSKTARGVVV